jgi:hypothetical protein
VEREVVALGCGWLEYAVSVAPEDSKRERFRERLERHRRRDQIALEVVRNEDGIFFDSLVVRIHLSRTDVDVVEALESYVDAWQRVGTRGGYVGELDGGFQGVVHDALIKGLQAAADGTTEFEVVLDLGSAGQPALDVFLRGLRGLKIHIGAIERVTLGWTDSEL